MKIVKSLREIPSQVNFLLTLGNFDGVHKGHEFLISSASKEAKEMGLTLAVITFEPHPISILSPRPNFRLTPVEDKRKCLAELGIDYLVEIPFTRDLSTLEPEQFMKENLFIHKGLKKLLIGHDFAFGANKSGGKEELERGAKENNILVTQAEKRVVSGERVSSSGIREHIQKGEVTEANESLGRTFAISGLVIRGDGRGHKIGFPTANVDYSEEQVVPSIGVYATKTRVDKMIYHSITNVGKSPTFKNDSEVKIETHLFDFDEDIYGSNIEVFFYDRIRSEKKFGSVQELTTQISEDCNKVKDFFKNA